MSDMSREMGAADPNAFCVTDILTSECGSAWALDGSFSAETVITVVLKGGPPEFVSNEPDRELKLMFSRAHAELLRDALRHDGPECIP